MSMTLGVVLLAALQAPAQFAVVSEGDTTWVPAGEAVEVTQGADVRLVPQSFDSTGAPVAVKAAWWHSGENEFFFLDTDGTFEALLPGEDRVMFHWTPADGKHSEGTAMVWVVIRVVAESESG
jgi:hypothetical protein